jgi:hypothetical protein
MTAFQFSRQVGADMVTYVFPAIRGHIGSTTYYTVTMAARELAAVARPANELAEWTRWTITERIQRDVTVNRVRDELIPYLLKSRDRFFGSLIVIAHETDVFEFEPLDTTGAEVRAAHKDASARMGFLTIEGGRMVALDGQHRLVGPARSSAVTVKPARRRSPLSLTTKSASSSSSSNHLRKPDGSSTRSTATHAQPPRTTTSSPVKMTDTSS